MRLGLKIAICATMALSACDVQQTNVVGPKETGQFTLKSIGNEMYAMIGDPTVAADAWVSRAQQQCAGKQICTVMGWTDGKNAATAMPMLDREAVSKVFNYSVNRNSNFENSLFDCDVFKGIPSERCIGKE